MSIKEEQLLKQTNSLRAMNDKAYENFQRFRLGEEMADFYDHVKPFADEVRENLEEWVPHVLKYLEKRKPDYIHAQQIDQLAENFEMVSVSCFQKDTKKKRFNEQYKSIEYTLKMVAHSIENVKEQK
ncbi:MAG: DUF1798 family protein [Alkalicoccus sp.]|nr:MAG: DUF1798 family protein [Alkalicoccus sp.]